MDTDRSSCVNKRSKSNPQNEDDAIFDEQKYVKMVNEVFLFRYVVNLGD